MTNKIAAVDTNVLIYLHDISDDRKRRIAENIVAENPDIPAQVLSEYLNVTRRILNLTKTEVIIQCVALFRQCEIVPVSFATLKYAADITQKYNFQIFDAIIVAASLEAGCTILYSEDMQHGFTIDNLTIVNPFI